MVEDTILNGFNCNGPGSITCFGSSLCHVVTNSSHFITEAFTETFSHEPTETCEKSRRRVDTEEVLNLVNHTTEEPGNLVPQPFSGIGNTIPQTFDKVKTRFCKFGNEANNCINKSCYNLRYGFHDFNNNGR